MIEIDEIENISSQEMANKIAQEYFGSQKYSYINEVLTHIKTIVENNCEFTSERLSGLFQVLQESGAFQVKA